jgi:hypothetical protein
VSVSIEIGSRLSRLEPGAFSWDGVRDIRIPSSVEVIGKQCFAWSRSLRSVTFDNDSSEVVTVIYKGKGK